RSPAHPAARRPWPPPGGIADAHLAADEQLAAGLEVVDLGTAVPLEALPGVRHLRLAAGTANFVEAPAMGAEP
ncbi:hypothetical protein ACV34M_31460, partial [Pseudomonas aeruginosa]